MKPLAAALGFGLLGATALAAQDCRQALALGLDVSGSVDAREYRQQLDGLAAALSDAKVRAALISTPAAPVQIMVYEWSGPADQTILVPWTAVSDAAALMSITDTLHQTARRPASPGTALGSAMALGVRYLDQRKSCWKQTLDISGDGKSNLGPRPRDVKRSLENQGVTINALVIGADAPHMGDLRQAEIGELSAYFNAEVILGPDAFVVTAIGFDDYAKSMTTKLLRELDGLVLSELDRQGLPER